MLEIQKTTITSLCGILPNHMYNVNNGWEDCSVNLSAQTLLDIAAYGQANRARLEQEAREDAENRLMFRQVKPAVQRGNERRRLAGKHREWIVIEVKMQKVELARTLPDALQHQHVQCIGITDRAVEAERAGPIGL